MRRLLGLLVLLYGLLLAVNTTAPTLAKLVGDRVSASAGQDCTAPLGSPPFGGLYGNCDASWTGLGSGGRLFGPHVDDRALNPVTAYRYPLLDSYAVLSPSNTDQVAAIIAVLIVVLGIMLLVSERKRRTDPSPTEVGEGDSAAAVAADG